ncbi:hypothetical protein GS399_04175 [Pedobacter sp. HMF7647]|uniref:Cytochrome c domain-containing protein n=1 Tax=Hufsiella arboris TaxID=2695275 RepID=A0A7K1Y6F2_9SPHI|nr:multiheme c-type cytochrome [Hufsiella arboris]MXV50156.1 hypothetical protein [Hufsiella arboris]
MRIKPVYLVPICIFAIVFIFSRCLKSSSKQDFRGPQYAGSEKCVNCHRDIYNSASHTAHFKTSQPTNKNDILSLVNQTSQFVFNDDDKVVVHAKGDSIYQTKYRGGSAIESHAIDVTFGAGVKAQTFGFWAVDGLHQLPLTYFRAANGWANSPGYPATTARFERVIPSRCLECHASYTAKEFTGKGTLAQQEKLIKGSIIFGIDCERCHGPAAEHVEFHTNHPEEKKPEFIAVYKQLSRQQKLDMCGVCHSGNDMDMQSSTFAFKPGDKLMDYYYPSFGESSSQPDVHGKQMQLLQSSKCFQESSTLTCTTCHNSHSDVKGLVAYSHNCRSCHQPQHNFCTQKDAVAFTLNTNCIDCHMPQIPSKVINVQIDRQNKTVPYLLRTHRIAVYPDSVIRKTTASNKSSS